MNNKDIKRFWSFINKSNGCWNWGGGINSTGRGMFWLNRKSQKAHRVSWFIHNGKIPDGMCILHKCDNGKCVNPKHLFLGTLGDNSRDMVKKGRHVGNRKLSNDEYNKIKELFNSGIKRKEIAEQFKQVEYEHICKIIKN